jgi:hypothetical protein
MAQKEIQDRWVLPKGGVNAQLISAAPYLLDACQQAVQRLDYLNESGPPEPDPTVIKLKAAIAKAKGR